MITAEKLQFLTTMDSQELSQTLAVSGHRDARFKAARFVGLTNGGQFCYRVTYFDELNSGQDAQCKVFVSYDPASEQVTADY